MKDHNEMPRFLHLFMWLILAVAAILGTFLILNHASHTPTYTIDGYFYLSKAKNLAEGHGLRTSWNDGLDTKYSPGYSVFLAVPFALGSSFVPLQTISYLLCLLLVLRIMMALDFDLSEQALAATAFAANPIVIKWFALPMAEGVALALALLSVNLALRFRQTAGYPSLFAACAVGGVAALTRVESLFLPAIIVAIVLPFRKTLSWQRLLSCACVFLIPLFAYWASLSLAAAQSPAYFGEFRGALSRVSLLRNFIYNIWVPFGFMHKPVRSLQELRLTSPVAILGAAWLLVGGIIFLEGLLCSVLGWLGQRAKTLSFLFLSYASLHSLWYYRYERFMIMAIPLAAMIWTEQLRTFSLLLNRSIRPFEKSGEGVLPLNASDKPPHRTLRGIAAVFMVSAQALLAAAGLYFGDFYSTRHAKALQEDTAWIPFQDVAKLVNTLNSTSRSAVLTDLGPHLAYFIDAQTYLDDEQGNYWHRAFPPERTLGEMNRLGIRFVATRKSLGKWLGEHYIPPEAGSRFEIVQSLPHGVLIIKYSPLLKSM